MINAFAAQRLSNEAVAKQKINKEAEEWLENCVSNGIKSAAEVGEYTAEFSISPTYEDYVSIRLKELGFTVAITKTSAWETENPSALDVLGVGW